MKRLTTALTLSLTLFLSGCGHIIRPADIPQEFTETVPPIETVADLERGMTFAQFVEVHGDLRAAYGVCQRRHAGLVEAVKISGSK